VRCWMMGATWHGRTPRMLSILEERAFPSARAGLSRRHDRWTQGAVQRRESLWKVLRPGCFDGLDLVIIDVAQRRKISLEWSPQAAAAGAKVHRQVVGFQWIPDVPSSSPRSPGGHAQHAKGIALVSQCTT